MLAKHNPASRNREAIKSLGSRFARLLTPKTFGVGFKTQLHVASFPPLLPPTPTP